MIFFLILNVHRNSEAQRVNSEFIKCLIMSFQILLTLFSSFSPFFPSLCLCVYVCTRTHMLKCRSVYRSETDVGYFSLVLFLLL